MWMRSMLSHMFSCVLCFKSTFLTYSKRFYQDAMELVGMVMVSEVRNNAYIMKSNISWHLWKIRMTWSWVSKYHLCSEQDFVFSYASSNLFLLLSSWVVYQVPVLRPRHHHAGQSSQFFFLRRKVLTFDCYHNTNTQKRQELSEHSISAKIFFKYFGKSSD